MSFLSKMELKKQLMNLGIKVEGNYIRKRDLKKLVSVKLANVEASGLGLYRDTDAVWEKLREVIPGIRESIRQLIKNLEKNADLKDKVKKDYGSGFIDDLGLIAKLYSTIK